MRTVRKYKNGGTEPTRFEKAFAKALEAGDKTFMFDKDGDGVMEEFTTDILTQTPGGRIGEEQVFTGTPEQFAIIQEGQGAYPLGTAEVGADFVPRNKEEQDAYDNLGVEGALAVRKLMANAKRRHRIKKMNFLQQNRRIEPNTKTDKYELIEKVKDEILQRTTRRGVRPQHI